MPFKMRTLDLSEDINTTFPYSLPSSQESTICLGHSCTRSIVVRVAAGVSQIFPAPRLEPACREKKEVQELRRTAPAGINLEFPDQKQLRSFTYQELEQATDDFNVKNILGRGGFGTIYKGRLSSGSLVAVKRLDQRSCQGEAQFRAEVQVGKTITHPDLLPLIGFCDMRKSKELLLVYPFMENGSLESYLYKRPKSQPPVDRDTRKRIALGVARGLSYLHDNCFLRIIHRDIKPSNILLDENLKPRVGDFGLAVFTNDDEIAEVRSESQIKLHSGELLDLNLYESTTFRLCGTHGYMAPEYVCEGKYSAKTDVYAYGIVLLELISSCDAVNLHSLAKYEGIGHPVDWVKLLVDTGNLEKIVDSRVWGNYSETGVERLIKLSLICTQLRSPAERPNMSEVVHILEGSSSSSLDTRWEEFQQNWKESYPKIFRFGDCSRDFTCHGTSHGSHLDPEKLSGPR